MKISDRWRQLAFMLDNVNQVLLHSYITVWAALLIQLACVTQTPSACYLICSQHISTWVHFHWILIPRGAYLVCLKGREKDLNRITDREEEINTWKPWRCIKINGNPTLAAILLVDVRASWEGLTISGNRSSKRIGQKDKVERCG